MKDTIKKLVEKMLSHPYMLRMGANKISQREKVDVVAVYEAKRLIKSSGHKALAEKCSEVGIPFEAVKNYRYKDKTFSIAVDGDGKKEDFKNEIVAAFDGLLDKYQNKPIKVFAPQKIKDPKALKVTISDEHIGMEPNPSASASLFQYEYNEEVYKKALEKVYSSIVKEYNTHGTFELLLLDDLGDREDGFNSLTTRGGHALEQNMSNAEMFDVCVDTKVRLVESLVNAKIANKIILRTVTNSNHSNCFALIVNKAIEKIINKMYSSSIVEVEILEKFIEHRAWGNHIFILCHGKDAKFQFKGLPLYLTDKTIKFITDYIDFYSLDTSKYIHFEKGDLHQIGYQKTNRFDYRNFMSFAPPSAYQQHNFGDSYSGYSIQVIPKYSNEISHTDYFIDYKKTI